ncbi:MAG: phosphohydrolase [Rhizobiaceae bacterium]|nr:MAG: phosphohydrolase [Rhizobiaceae bacterium]
MTASLAESFSPHQDLARSLIPHASAGDDGSHDLAHIARVFKNAMRIHQHEGGDGRVLAAAVLLHDCVAVEKNSTHSFSANLEPQTIEAKILQDADRLDAIGMIGAARCFYIAGRMGSALYDPADPLAKHRPLDDRTFAIDHFETKLFKLADGFKTQAGRQAANERHQRLKSVLDLFLDEI